MGWWLDLVRCPVSGEPLLLEEGTLQSGMLRAQDTVLRYPVVAGVPFLVPNAEVYLSRHRDTVLAALAEAGRASEEAVARITSLAGAFRGSSIRLDDDWTETEVDGAAPRFAAPAGEAAEPLTQLLALARRSGAPARLRHHVAKLENLELTVEVGVGAGTLTRVLSEVSKQVLAIDISPRAAFRAVGLPNVAAAVMDAEALALAPASVDLLVAANLVDLLDAPFSFLNMAANSLREGGNLLLTTPDPWPWEGDSSLAAAMVEHVGLRLDVFEDDLLWLRDHGARELQVFVVQLLKAQSVKPQLLKPQSR